MQNRIHQAGARWTQAPSRVAGAVGRPGSILDVGGALAAIPKRDDVKVTTVLSASRAPDARSDLDEVVLADTRSRESVAASIGARTFDLVVLSEIPVSQAEGRALMSAFTPFIGKEGHLIALTDRPTDVVPVLEHAGLEILRKLPGLIVARRPPKPGPLSLTVGMLTMNEEESIERMMLEIKKVAPDASILCVDSSNKDQTHVIAERMGARVLRQLPPRGHGPAMELLMYEAAKQSDALIYLDCDFTYPTSAIPRIRAILESGVDLVNASRTRTRPEAMPLPNYLANKTFVLASRALHGIPASDLHSGMRGYRSSLIRAFAFDGEGDALPIDTLLWPAKCGYNIVEIPIRYEERVGASKLRKVAGTYWTFVRLGKTIGVGRRRAFKYDVRESGT